MHKRGAAIGAEFKGKGVHVGLGPMMNIMRAPAGGRAWEGYVLYLFESVLQLFSTAINGN